MAANGHRCPATPSYVQPRNTWPDGTSSRIWHHPATLRPRLTVKQVGRQTWLSGTFPRRSSMPSSTATAGTFVMAGRFGRACLVLTRRWRL